MILSRIVLLVVAATLSCASLAHSHGPESAVTKTAAPGAALAIAWNELVLELAVAEDKLLTLKGVRTAAMTHIAMHDALNAIRRRYHSYAYEHSHPGADPLAAAARAAYEVVADQYPDQKPRLNAELWRWLAKSDTPGSSAIALGKASAAAILAQRAGDNWNADPDYDWHPMAPGVYAEFNEHSNTPEGFVFGAGWAVAKPFLLPSHDYFRSLPPPRIDSDAYTEAFNEVKAVGHHQSASRTADQSHLAMWWKDFVEHSHNRLARQLTAREHLDLWQASRLFALLNMSVFDGYVDVFDNKFHYNHWRPYTAIRWAANDDNPDTVADPDWNNLHRHTYAFPSYPSAHGTVCAAAMTVLENSFGEDYAFTMSTPEVDSAGPLSEKTAMRPPTRSFDNFQAAAVECALSRVYLGIHFRYDSIEGNRLGRRVGRYAVAGFLSSYE